MQFVLNAPHLAMVALKHCPSLGSGVRTTRGMKEEEIDVVQSKFLQQMDARREGGWLRLILYHRMLHKNKLPVSKST